MNILPNPGSFYQGDELLSVNGIDVRGKSAFDVSSMLQGPKETFVTIKVLTNLMNIVFRVSDISLCSLFSNYLTFLILHLG
jgi:hypothetical protein